MDRKEFIKLINIIVDSKLKNLPVLVKQEVELYFKNNKSSFINKPNIKKHISDDNINDTQYTMNTKKINTEGVVYSKNKTINDILLETAKNIKNTPVNSNDHIGYDKLLESVYHDDNNQYGNGFNVGNMYSNQQSPQSNPPDSLKSQMVDLGATPEIANIMIRDYTKILKEADKKAANYRNK